MSNRQRKTRIVGYGAWQPLRERSAKQLIARVIADNDLTPDEFFDAKVGRPSVSPFVTSGRRAHALKVLSYILLEHYEMTGPRAGELLGVDSSRTYAHADWVALAIADGDIKLAAEIQDYREIWERWQNAA